MNLQSLKDHEYKYDQTLLKVFSDGENKKIKLIRMNCLKTSGLEIDKNLKVERGKINDSKLTENILRSKSKIFELAFCNPWDWFFTGTINPNKQNRTDLELFHKQLTQWLRDYNKKYDLDIKFLFVLKNTKTAKVGTFTVSYMVYLLNILHNLKLAIKWARDLLIRYQMEI